MLFRNRILCVQFSKLIPSCMCCNPMVATVSHTWKQAIFYSNRSSLVQGEQLPLIYSVIYLYLDTLCHILFHNVLCCSSNCFIMYICKGIVAFVKHPHKCFFHQSRPNQLTWIVKRLCMRNDVDIFFRSVENIKFVTWLFLWGVVINDDNLLHPTYKDVYGIDFYIKIY